MSKYSIIQPFLVCCLFL